MVRHRRLILAVLGLLVSAALGGCVTAPKKNPEDPEVWHPPKSIVYPLPD
jgi:hypothetical protein